MQRLVFALALACGACTANTFRNPQFTQAQAPTPTLTTSVVKCLATAHASTDLIANALTAEIEQRAKTAQLPPEERLQLCGELGTDAAVSTWSSDWSLGNTIATPLARSLAKTQSAGSVLIPLVRTDDVCDATSCKERTVNVGLFLFSADGTLLWKGTASRGVSAETVAKSDAESLAKSLMSDLPADLRR